MRGGRTPALAIDAPRKLMRWLAERLPAAGIRPLSLSRAADALLVVRPGADAGPCVDGLPTGVLWAERRSELEPWLAAVTSRPLPTRAVLAMWKPEYVSIARRFRRAVGGDAWTANRIDRDELCRRLARGPRLVAYFGHGHARGFSGYRGLRIDHLRPGRPCGAVLAFSCGTIPFGRDWVHRGLAAAFVGSVGLTPSEFNRRIAGSLPRFRRLDRWIRSLSPSPEAASLRIIGNPLQRI